MKRLTLGAAALALALLAGGCGNAAEGIMEESVKIEEEMADTIAGLKTVADVEANRARIESLARRSMQLLKKHQDVKASLSDMEAASKKFKDRADAARKKQESVPPEVLQAFHEIAGEAAAQEMMK